MNKKLPILLVSFLALTTINALQAEDMDRRIRFEQPTPLDKEGSAPPPPPIAGRPGGGVPPIGRPPQAAVLREAGNDIFGTIQETIKKLDANPNTNWEKVDLEALRQHLIDMKHFTVDVTVVAQRNTKKGTQIIVRATTKAASKALARAMSAHPSMLKAETGWDMSVKAEGNQYKLKINTNKPAEVARLRALGYIGIMALGNHHQIHHWMMASGAKPHRAYKHH
jgi:hypothetical protein